MTGTTIETYRSLLRLRDEITTKYSTYYKAVVSNYAADKISKARDELNTACTQFSNIFLEFIEAYEVIVLSIGCGDSIQSHPPFIDSMDKTMVLCFDPNLHLRYPVDITTKIKKGSPIIFDLAVKIIDKNENETADWFSTFITKLLTKGKRVILMDSCGSLSTLVYVNLIRSHQALYGQQLQIIESYFNEQPIAILHAHFFALPQDEMHNILHNFYKTGELDSTYGCVFKHLSELKAHDLLQMNSQKFIQALTMFNTLHKQITMKHNQNPRLYKDALEHANKIMIQYYHPERARKEGLPLRR